MRLHRQSGETRDRVGDDFVDRLPLVDDAIDERGVGAVFEQPPHEIRQQILVTADRRVDPAWPVEMPGGEMLGSDDLLVERLPHAVQALKLPIPAIAGHFENRRHGMRVVRRELRIKLSSMGEQPARAGEIGDVGRDLAGVDRITVQPALLGALDLAVPIGAFDQAHHQPPPAAPGKIGEPIDDGQGPLLISLDGEAEAIPAGEVRREHQPLDEVQREFEAVRFFRIDRKADAGLPRVTCQFEQARSQFAQYPVALRHLVTRVQGRQFYRDARSLGDVPAPSRKADRRDCMIISREVARGIGRGARRLTQHVVRVPEAVPLGLAGMPDRLFDRASDDELAAEDAHRRGHRLAHHRLARAGDKTAQSAAQIVFRRFGMQQATGQHQRPGRGVDKDRFGPAEVAFPIRLADLIADQPIDRLRIGHAQQGLGEA